MTIENTYIEKVLKSLLQKNIRLQFKNKVFKSGKLILFKQSNYHLAFILHSHKKGNVKFEIPIPFAVEYWPEDHLVYLDYRLGTLAKRKEELLQQLKSVSPVKNSKYYDSILEIDILPDEEII
jgi:hypothetical protein